MVIIFRGVIPVRRNANQNNPIKKMEETISNMLLCFKETGNLVYDIGEFVSQVAEGNHTYSEIKSVSIILKRLHLQLSQIEKRYNLKK